MIAVFALLVFGILTIWVPERWAWGAFQIGVFAVAGVRLCRPRPVRLPSPWILLAAVTVWPLVQLALRTTVSRDATWNAALDWFTFLTLFFVVSQEDSRRLLPAITIFGTVLAAIATLQNYSSRGLIFWLFPSGYTEDVLGPFVNRNQYAAWVELLFPIALYLAATAPRLRALYLSAAAVLFASVVASASRAGFLLVAAEALVVPALIAWRKRSIQAGPMLAGAAAIVLASAAAGWHTLGTRLAAMDDQSLRIDAVRASLAMLRVHPWTGSGLGTWSTVYPAYASFDSGLFMNQAHNDWAQWAAEGGVPFFFFIFLFAALLWKPATRSIYGVGAIAFLLHALVDYPTQQRPALAAWFFALSAIVCARRHSADRGLLPGARAEQIGLNPGDPAGVPEDRAPASPRPLRGRNGPPPGRTADEEVELRLRDAVRSGGAAGV